MNALRWVLPVWILVQALVGTANAETTETARIVEILDAETLRLGDGRLLRLAGLNIPRPPGDDPATDTASLAARAKALLTDLAEGREATLTFSASGRDRYGRMVAQVRLAGPVWLQGELLSAGLARVMSRADERAMVPEMLALERQARAARRGLWGEARYGVREAERAGDGTGGFQIVEGRVLAVDLVRGRAFVNFGSDWRSDFTVSLQPKVRRRFEQAGLDPLNLEGRRLRVRGWLAYWNGPFIEATHPEQVELLED